jgi:LysR family nitrogen assimilation transcriptional regulator
MVDLKRLDHFLCVAELGSLSRASDRTRIAQPALSRQMRLLEEQLGIALFARHRRGMQLTAAGEELRKRITGPLRQLNQTFTNFKLMSDETGGSMALGLPPTVSHILAARLARRVAVDAPDLSLRIIEGYAGHLIEWLQRGEIDAAILYGPAADFHLRSEELLMEELFLVGPPGSGLDARPSIMVEELVDLPLVLPSHPHGLRIILENAAIRARVKLSVKYEADSLLVLKDLVESGLGYTALPLSAMSGEIAAGRLSVARLSSPRVLRHLILCTQPDAAPSRAARRVRHLLRDEIACLVSEGAWPAFLQYEPDFVRPRQSPTALLTSVGS